MLSFEDIAWFTACLQVRFDMYKVRLTGGDPLVRRGIVDLVGMLARLGIADLAMTTNGQELESMARTLKQVGLSRVNISLDSLDPRVYRDLTCGGLLDRTLAGIDAALHAGLQPVKLNTVVLGGINDFVVIDALTSVFG